MPFGIITKGIGGFYYVKVYDRIYECKARGIFRKESRTPLPGDNVKISIVDDIKGIGSIDEIMQRQSQLVRPSVANVTQVAVVIAAKSPLPDLLLLDKLLITAALKDIKSMICVNKIDLDEGKEYQQLVNIYRKAGYCVLALSSKQKIGFEELRNSLNNQVSVFAGQSGVGKSSILNNLMDTSVMETGDISKKIERGKHTTRHAELIELHSGGYVVDTPGFSSFEMTGLTFNELEHCYPEFQEHLNKCRFTGCSHISEPDCRVKEAVMSGLIDNDRYERYTQLYNILKQDKDYRRKSNK